MPVYLVKTPTVERVVEATTSHGAIAYVARDTITAKNLTASELVGLIRGGVTVEKAKAEAATQAAAPQATMEETHG